MMSVDSVGSRPADALVLLGRELSDEGTLLSSYVVSPPTQETTVAEIEASDFPQPIFGPLAAAGPRAVNAAAEYALVVESVREGYLLHFAEARLLAGVDADLALLAGDYLYALGLDRLARLDDAAAVAVLGDLISLAALCHSESFEAAVAPLWLATAVAVGAGEAAEIRSAKQSLRALEPNADQDLWRAAEITAHNSEMGPALLLAAKAIDFPAVNP